MPLHLPPLTRRTFLRRSLAATASLLTFPSLRAAESSADPDRWALLSDTHIAADRAAIVRTVNMTEHLEAAVKGVRALASRPAGVFVNGDCAVLKGLAEDYATLSTLITPLREAGLPIHLTLGNHDDRDIFRTSLKAAIPAAPPLVSKHVSIVEGARANWFLLDSLDEVNKTPGLLGDEQRAWLAKALDANTAKPALVMVHHNPISGTPGKKRRAHRCRRTPRSPAPAPQCKGAFLRPYAHLALCREGRPAPGESPRRRVSFRSDGSHRLGGRKALRKGRDPHPPRTRHAARRARQDHGDRLARSVNGTP
jgi:hypothetical protein